MEAKINQKWIAGYGIRLLYAFSLAFYGLNLVFSIIYMIFLDWKGFYNQDFMLPVADPDSQSMVFALSFLVFLIMVISGIVLLIFKKLSGSYLIYTGNLVLIILFILRSEPDWLSSLVILVLSILYLIPVRLIGNHSKLQKENKEIQHS
jgi:hypothetical protein